jgi:beta-phosphoglucomutase family hydrolase
MEASGPKGAIFDLDGVITASAHLHLNAWKAMFDEFLKSWSERKNVAFEEFTENDYLSYVDGKPRYEGVKSFLESRGIDLPFGDPEDPPDEETCCGLGNRKNVEYQKTLKEKGAKVFDSSVRLIKELKSRGVRIGVASSSKNTKLVLEQTGLESLFETRVCGMVSAEMGLKGKPEPDIFVQAAENLGLEPGECLMVEDAISGVKAGARGNFGLVLGLARHIDGQKLEENGADWVVGDLGELSVEAIFEWFDRGMEEDGWFLTYHGFEPEGEKLRQALTTVGNGYFGTVGCFECARAGDHHYPGTYVAGLYNKLPTPVHGRNIYNNDFVNCPNWLLLEIAIGESDFTNPLDMEVIDYRHRLDMYRAVVERMLIVKDRAGRLTRICSRRVASMEDPHVGAIQLNVWPLNYSGKIRFRSAIDADVINDGVPRYRDLASKHIEPVETGSTPHGIFVHSRTNTSKVDVAMGARTRLFAEGEEREDDQTVVIKDDEAAVIIEAESIEGRPVTVEKLVSIHTSRDPEGVDPVQAAKDFTGRDLTFEQILDPHARAWHDLWQRVDIRIDGDRFAQRVARLHAYHLLVTASPHNTKLDAGMPARGLHGEAYRGHVFWDEVYIFPFYNAHFPEITRALLMYRYRRLDGAREYARENGFKGAMYPWQTADGGDEETQVVHYNPLSGTWGPDLSRRQRHVSIAIFYNIYDYWQQSGDDEFMAGYGLEMMLEIARFWANIAKKDEKTGRFHIKGVMGPDEYHEKLPGSDEDGLKDNAYTNIMTVWLMEKALDLLDNLPAETIEEVSKKIGFERSETDRWREMTKKMNVVVEDGIISQFDGYMGLEELDWDAYRKKYGNIHRMDRILKAEGDSPDKYKVSKQADVLMTYYLLPPEEVKRILEQLGHEVGDAMELLRRNYDFYLKRTSHGSTLSKVVHAAIAKDMGVEELTWRWFLEAMKSDIYDSQGGTTQEGIHCGVMAGTLAVIVRNFAGMTVTEGAVNVQPSLPEHWSRLAFSVNNRDATYYVDVDQRQASVQVETGMGKQEIQVSPGQHKVLKAGDRSEIRLDYRRANGEPEPLEAEG